MRIKTLAFKSALSKVAPIAGGRSVSIPPTINHVLIEAKNGTLILTANNLDACVQAKVECEGTLAPVCVHFRAIQAATNTPADGLEIDMHGPKLRVKGSGECHLSIMDAAEFPAIPQGKWTEIGAGGKDLAEMIRGVSWCAVQDDGEPMAAAVWVKTDAKLAEVASSDKKHLNYAKRALICAKAEFMVPFQFSDLLCDALEDGALFVGERQVKAVNKSLTVICKQMEGPYFGFRPMLELDCPTIGKIEPATVLPSIETCRSLANGDICNILFEFTADGLWVRFTGKSHQHEIKLEGKYEPAQVLLAGDRASDLFSHADIATVKAVGMKEGFGIRLEYGDFTNILAGIRMNQ